MTHTCCSLRHRRDIIIPQWGIQAICRTGVGRAWDFVRLNTEAAGADIMLEIFIDRLAVTSPGMCAHNGMEPEFTAEEHRFTVRLLKAPMVEDINGTDR